MTQVDDVEADSVAAHRSWSIDELDASPDRVYPADLVPVLRSLAADQLRPPASDQ